MPEQNNDNINVPVEVELKFDKKAKVDVVNNIEKAAKESVEVWNAAIKSGKKKTPAGLLQEFTEDGKLSKNKYYKLYKQNGELYKQEFVKMRKYFAAGASSKISYENASTLTNIPLEIPEDFGEKVEEVSKQTEKIAKDTKKTIGPVGKLVNTIKRVGFYRLARGFFATLKNIFSEGISGLAQFDKSANETVSELVSSYDKLKASVAIAVMPLLQAITPLVTSISNSIANVANSISKAQAKAQGLSTYTKINADYSKDFAENMNSALLSFDKFESLNKQSDPYITASIDDEVVDASSWLNDNLFEVSVTLAGILTTLTAIGVSKIITWIKSGEALTALANIGAKLDGFAFTVGVLAAGITVLALGIKEIADNWGNINFSDWEKAVSIISAAAAAALTLAFALKFAQYPLPVALGLAAVMGGAILGLSSNLATITKFANGGIPEQGSLFIAGEAGAELVHTMPSGQTGVTNISQFKQAMVEALYEAQDVFGGGSGGVVLNLDGAEIARSSRFKSELNRSNSGLNLR